ncbi:hypothetical protein TRIUR3_17067 [Triticum urartu]|uniref:Uncharacterized protein n=1 Tax=Triticum urartu TaxID=4572 RepID=M8APT6_TRIUA|nr:hypothetical protein TRIUR3_17067 [Triticum urartu]
MEEIFNARAPGRKPAPPRPAIPEEDGDGRRGLDKGLGINKGFAAKYDLGDEVWRGHFSYTCAARIRKGARKGDAVAVKVIPKAKDNENVYIVME